MGDVAERTADNFDRESVLSVLREVIAQRDEGHQNLLEMLTDKVTERLQRRGVQSRAPSISSSSSSSEPCGARSPPAAVGQPAGPDPAQPDIEPTLGLIANSKGRLVHAICVGPPHAETAAWITRCGWKFGHSTFARFPETGDSRCGKCWCPEVGS